MIVLSIEILDFLVLTGDLVGFYLNNQLALDFRGVFMIIGSILIMTLRNNAVKSRITR